MARVVVLGAGLGGIPAAYEMRGLLREGDTLTVVSDRDRYQFYPSNPWLAVGWRGRAEMEVPLGPVFQRRGIAFTPVGARRLLPDENRIELKDGGSVAYDYLILATGPALAHDEVEGLGPETGFTQSICSTDHAARAGEAWADFVKDPGPVVVGAAPGVSCFGPVYEFAMVMDTDLKRRKIRDRVPMTLVTPEPYVGHLGLGGVGDTKGLLESELRERSIRWICNARTTCVEQGKVFVTEVDDQGREKRKHELPFRYAMIMPAFRGIDALAGIEGLVNPRGFVLVDRHQRNARYPNIFAIGVCIAIPPVEPTPLPAGVPKTGYMIESMGSAAAGNIRALLDGGEPSLEATWNAICLADFGDSGVAFVANPQIPPRNVNWSSQGKWVHLAKIAFEKYFLHKVRKGQSEPFYEKYVLKLLGIDKLKPGGAPPGSGH